MWVCGHSNVVCVGCCAACGCDAVAAYMDGGGALCVYMLCGIVRLPLRGAWIVCRSLSTTTFLILHDPAFTLFYTMFLVPFAIVEPLGIDNSNHHAYSPAHKTCTLVCLIT